MDNYDDGWSRVAHLCLCLDIERDKSSLHSHEVESGCDERYGDGPWTVFSLDDEDRSQPK